MAKVTTDITLLSIEDQSILKSLIIQRTKIANDIRKLRRKAYDRSRYKNTLKDLK